MLSSLYSAKVPSRTVGHWLAGDRTPRTYNTFEEEPSSSLSYVIGAVLGDGSLIPKSNIVKLEVADREFADQFNEAMSSLFGRAQNRVSIRRFESERLPLYVVRYSSRQLLNLLQRPLSELNDYVSPYPTQFLRGFFDAEGYVSVSAQKCFSLRVGAENSSHELLLLVSSILSRNLGIRHSLRLRRKAGFKKRIRGEKFESQKTSGLVEIRNLEEISKFRELVGFSIHRKMDRLSDALLFREMGSKKACKTWKLNYVKQRGEWIRRNGLNSIGSFR